MFARWLPGSIIGVVRKWPIMLQVDPDCAEREQAGNGDRMQFDVVGFDQAEAGWLSAGSARRVPVVGSRSG